jgi:low affinity Fe/Cu permease
MTMCKYALASWSRWDLIFTTAVGIVLVIQTLVVQAHALSAIVGTVDINEHR